MKQYKSDYPGIMMSEEEGMGSHQGSFGTMLFFEEYMRFA
jgi:hypothetical protein